MQRSRVLPVAPVTAITGSMVRMTTITVGLKIGGARFALIRSRSTREADLLYGSHKSSVFIEVSRHLKVRDKNKMTIEL
jgi:hypothetical protein